MFGQLGADVGVRWSRPLAQNLGPPRQAQDRPSTLPVCVEGFLVPSSFIYSGIRNV